MDTEVMILEGELLMGIIDKNSIGNTKSGGITHVLMNDKGPEAARDFLGLNQRMVNYWLMNRGFWGTWCRRRRRCRTSWS